MYFRSQVKGKAVLIIHALKDTRKPIWERWLYGGPNAAGVCTFFDTRVNTREIHGKVSFTVSDEEEILGIFTTIHKYKNKDSP